MYYYVISAHLRLFKESKHTFAHSDKECVVACKHAELQMPDVHLMAGLS